MKAQTICRLCRNVDGNVVHVAREMMLGTRHEFAYIECARCGCVQIQSIPENLSDYYPANYYSFAKRSRPERRRVVRAWVDRKRVLDLLSGGSYLGDIANRVSKPLEYPSWIQLAHATLESRVLDVGCGQGRLLQRMSMGGFRHLEGLDPFVDEDIRYRSGVHVKKATLEGFASGSSKQFDLIMFHHSFEHMPDPQRTLEIARHLLSGDGRILVRIPLADSFAWERYGVNWVQLDAPRHLFLHTKTSMRLLAKNCSLRISKIVYDSTSFQFTGSELYGLDIPLLEHKSERKRFSADQMQRYNLLAEELNAQRRGDQAAFFLARQEESAKGESRDCGTRSPEQR